MDHHYLIFVGLLSYQLALALQMFAQLKSKPRASLSSLMYSLSLLPLKVVTPLLNVIIFVAYS